jgi:hypothetical protein
LLPISFLATRVTKADGADLSDWKKLERVLRYLKCTKELCLTLEPKGYCPSGCARYGTHFDLKSHSGSSTTLGKGTFIAQSQKQKLNTRSSTEAKFVSASDYATRLVTYRDFMIAQGCSLQPAKIFQDNTSAIKLIKNGRCALSVTN